MADNRLDYSGSIVLVFFFLYTPVKGIKINEEEAQSAVLFMEVENPCFPTNSG